MSLGFNIKCYLIFNSTVKQIEAHHNLFIKEIWEILNLTNFN